MKGKRLVFRDGAEADLVALYSYIAHVSGSFHAPYSFTERLRDACFKLVDFPERGAPRDDIRAGLRILSIERKTVIIYFVKGGDVIISNIFHGGRDWEAFFLDETKSTMAKAETNIKNVEFIP